MNKQFMVLGIKGFPVKDEETDADNPYLFCSLKRALEIAEKITTEDRYGFATVVMITELEAFEGEGNKRKIPPN